LGFIFALVEFIILGNQVIIDLSDIFYFGRSELKRWPGRCVIINLVVIMY